MRVGSFMMFLILMVFGLVLLVSSPEEKSVMSESALKIFRVVDRHIGIWWDKYIGPDKFYIEQDDESFGGKVVGGDPDIYED